VERRYAALAAAQGLRRQETSIAWQLKSADRDAQPLTAEEEKRMEQLKTLGYVN
jgi:hypothetical protein